MSSEWSSGKLGDFVELKRGYDLPQAKRQPGDIPLVSSSGVSDRHSVAMVKGPGVVTGRYGTIGQVFYVEDDFWPLNTTLYVRDFKGNDRKFIHYFLKTLDFHAYSDKAAVPGVNRNHLHEAVVSIPPLSVQREIAAFLGALDDRITVLRETNATLESIAQALFKSWFVDFDPGRAKMEGRAPEGMDEATAALFPDSFEETELGSVPRGWGIARLDSFLELAYGKALKAETRRPGGVPVYGSGGITGWHDTALIHEPSLVVGRKGTVGSIYWESRPFFPIDTVFYVRTKQPLTYCHQLLKTLGLDEMNSDAAVPGLNRENVYRLQVPDAPPTVLAAFDKIALVLRQKINHNEAQAETLTASRDTLLPRLIGGNISAN